jgi:hypothetical protein
MMDHEEIEAVVKRAARQATIETLHILGFDLDDKAGLRADLAHLRKWRLSVNQIEQYGWHAVITTVIGGALAALWIGIEAMLTHIPPK